MPSTEMDVASLSPLAAPPTTRDDFGLVELVALLWRRKLVLLLAVLVGLAIGVTYLNFATYKYTAELRISPVESQAKSLLSRLGGIASAAGLGIGQKAEATPFDYYLEAVYSLEVSEQLAKRPELMRGAFPTEWDGQRWREPQSFVGDLVKTGKRILGIPVYSWRQPDANRLNDWIDENVILIRSTKEAIATLSLTNRDSAFAARLLDELHAESDTVVRRRTLDRTGGTISYLRDTLARVTIAEHREALAEALGEQERQRMMAAADVPYAADRFGDVKISSKPTSPRPVVILALGIIGGLAIGVVGILAHAMIAAARTRARLGV